MFENALRGNTCTSTFEEIISLQSGPCRLRSLFFHTFFNDYVTSYISVAPSHLWTFYISQEDVWLMHIINVWKPHRLVYPLPVDIFDDLLKVNLLLFIRDGLGELLRDLLLGCRLDLTFELTGSVCSVGNEGHKKRHACASLHPHLWHCQGLSRRLIRNDSLEIYSWYACNVRWGTQCPLDESCLLMHSASEHVI